jgi:hypothetical protein
MTRRGPLGSAALLAVQGQEGGEDFLRRAKI